MEINFNNLNQAIAALEQCASENKGKLTDTAAIRVSDLCSDVATFLKKLTPNDVLQEGCEGTFEQAVGSLKRGFLVRRKGWSDNGMFLFLRPFDSLKDEFIIDTALSLPYNFKEWVKAHPNADGERFFTQYICMKAADGSVVNGWLASQTDMFSEDWVLVDPNE